MIRFQLTLLFVFVIAYCQAGIIRGRITDNRQQPLPFATVMLKGTTIGTTTNANGEYRLDAPDGNYTVVCQYIGFRKKEQPASVSNTPLTLDFILEPLSLQIKEVVIKAGGEDPAYAIIRQAIKKRSFYQNQVKAYTSEAYIKGLLKLRGVPKSFFGQKVDTKDLGVDSAGKGIVFLSESLTKISYQAPDQLKLEVVSSRQSGGGFGFNFPTYINFYDNNVTAIISQVSPRGFISPIAQNAISFYKYRLEGSFVEDGRTVNKIAVIPRRKYEPLFSGHIFITDGDWRIHSTDLELTKDYQLELIDTLRIRQTHVPVTPEVWRTKDQVLYIALKQFGFNAAGSFVNVYSNYNLQPDFKAKYFNKTIMKYDTAFNDKKIAYWDSIRPVPLEVDEQKDFHQKDSVAHAMKDSLAARRNIDSLRKNQPRIKWSAPFFGGITRHYYFRKDTGIDMHTLRVKPLLTQLEYNTVEGLVVSIEPDLQLSLKGNNRLTIEPVIRYGFSNTHLNAYTRMSWIKDARLGQRLGRNTWSLAGGKRISQFNKEEPIRPLINEIYTLLLKENYMKLYENWFGQLQFKREFQNSAVLSAGLTYEDRIPVVNTTDFVLFKNDQKTFTPNYPVELTPAPMVRHQALVFDLGFRIQPGQRFIEMPDRKIAIGSDLPTFELRYSKGIYNLAGSDVDFDKWQVRVFDKMNFKLFGEFHYNIGIGGFINDKRVGLPDYRHFNGNQTFFNDKYLNSFSLAPYYQYSTTAAFYTTGHVEHHFNGMLTNKIPLLQKLKWNLVAGANAFYVNGDNNYVEVFAGLENIFKVLRVDVVAGYQSKDDPRVGVRLGMGGLLGGMIRTGRR